MFFLLLTLNQKLLKLFICLLPFFSFSHFNFLALSLGFISLWTLQSSSLCQILSLSLNYKLVFLVSFACFVFLNHVPKRLFVFKFLWIKWRLTVSSGRDGLSLVNTWLFYVQAFSQLIFHVLKNLTACLHWNFTNEWLTLGVCKQWWLLLTRLR